MAFRRISNGRSRFLRERRHAANVPAVREAGLGRKDDIGNAFIRAEWIGLILPIEIARIGAHGMVGMFGGLMIGEEAFRIFVEAATLGIVPNAGEKARHSFVFLFAAGPMSALHPRAAFGSALTTRRFIGRVRYCNSDHVSWGCSLPLRKADIALQRDVCIPSPALIVD